MAKLSEMNIEEVKKSMDRYEHKIKETPLDEEVKRKLTLLKNRYDELNNTSKVTKFHSQSEDLSHEKDATFIKRLLAFILDGVFIGIVGQILTVVISYILPFVVDVNSSTGMIVMTSVILFTSMIICPYFYYVVPISKAGQSLGKKLLKIQIISNNEIQELTKGRIIKREFLGKFISGLVFLVGYLVVLFKKDAWHDKIAKTRVISLN